MLKDNCTNCGRDLRESWKILILFVNMPVTFRLRGDVPVHRLRNQIVYTRNAVTFSSYLTYKPPAGFVDELIHGEIVLSPSPKPKHADLCSRLYDLLKQELNPEFVIRLDTTHYLGDVEGPRPDVFVISTERWKAANRTDSYPKGGPELAIEVWSDWNTEAEMTTKRGLYVSDPQCGEVWEVKPDDGSLTRYRRESATLFSIADMVPLPPRVAVRPDASISLNDLFSGIVA